MYKTAVGGIWPVGGTSPAPAPGGSRSKKAEHTSLWQRPLLSPNPTSSPPQSTRATAGAWMPSQALHFHALCKNSGGHVTKLSMMCEQKFCFQPLAHLLKQGFLRRNLCSFPCSHWLLTITRMILKPPTGNGRAALNQRP